MSLAVELAERRILPDRLVRRGIRGLLRDRLVTEEAVHSREGAAQELFARLRREPIAVRTEAANSQHYELPPEFFECMLGPARKYSSCFWPDSETTLAEAEEVSLELSAQHAEVEDGMSILDLGCGWGSFSVWLAEHLPRARITAVSNSKLQARAIQERCAARKLVNVEVVTQDVNELSLEGQFDRIVSVEAFEHFRNHGELLQNLRALLTEQGKLFVHIFCHRSFTYLFEETEDEWMGRYFFTGGMMPSQDLLPSYSDVFTTEKQWKWNGTHYGRTLRAWLGLLDANRAEALEILRSFYGNREAGRWFQRWRMFLMACEELFNWNDGNEWFVSHYRLAPK